MMDMRKNLNRIMINQLLGCLFFIAPMLGFSQAIPTYGDCLGGFTVCELNYNQQMSFEGEGNYLDEIDNASSCLNSGESNNAWYIITVQTPGTFGFNILPNCDNADYDWALFNLTSASCSDIATDPTLEVACNFSGSFFPPITGMNNGANPQDENTIVVAAGEIYALLVNNFSGLNQCGYILDLSLSTAGIIDILPPTISPLQNQVNCGSNLITLNFSEFINCESITTSDFFLINPLGDEIPISGISSVGCANGGSYDKEFTFLLNEQLFLGGVYTLGRAGLIEDLCGNIAADTELVVFNIDAFTIASNFTPVDCRTNNGTATADITGGTAPFIYNWQPANQSTPTATGLPFGWQEVIVIDADGCTQSDSIFVEDNSNFSVDVVVVPDTCSFGLGSAFAIVNGGEPFTSPPAELPYIYFWDVQGQATDTTFVDSLLTGDYVMAVRDSFGCRYEIDFTVPDYRFNLEADFIFSPDENPITGILPTVSFLNQSENATEFTWNFGSGDVSTEFEPDYIFPGSGTYDVKLIAENPFGCKDSISKPVTIDFMLNFYAPNAFSPNGDFVNDTFNVVVTGIFDSTFTMTIFDRWGGEVYNTSDKRIGWDGKGLKSGKYLPGGFYIYRAFFYDQSGKKHLMTGKVLLIG
jgi:gliding motility-associated-like protein